MLRRTRLAQSTPTPWLGALALLIGLIGARPLAVSAQQVDLVLNVVDTPDPIPAGGVITYHVSVVNDAGVTATGVQFAFTIPVNALYQGFSGAGVNCSGATIGQAGPLTVTCTLPDLPVTSSSLFTVQLRSVTASVISAGATASANQADLQPANNSAPQTTTVVAGANVSLTMTGPTTAPSGSSVAYNVQLANAGPDAAAQLQVQFPVPTGFIATGSLPAGCVLATGTVTCTVSGTIASSGTRTIGPFTGQIAAGFGSTITAAASVQVSPGAPIGTPADPDASDNTGLVNTTVTGGSDVQIQKSRTGSAPYLVGGTFSFILTTAYTGDSPSGLTITDLVPANYTINLGSFAATQSGWSCGASGQLVTCTRAAGGVVGFNQSLGTITIPVTINSAGNAVTNNATIASATPVDPNLSNNSATDGPVNLVPPSADLALTKSGPLPALVVTGQPFNFTLRTSNGGPSPFSGTIVMTDALPAGLTLDAITSNGWSCAPAAPQVGPASIVCQLTYSVGSPLAAGANTPAVVLQTTATTTGSLSNSATLTTINPSVPDPNAGNDQSTSTVTASLPVGSADIRVLKSVDLATIPAGDVLTYTLEIVNDGPIASTAIQLTDDLNSLINSAIGPTGAGFVGFTITPGAIPLSDISCSTSATGGASRRFSCNVTSLPVCTAGVDCPRIQVMVRPGGDGGSRTNTVSVISNATADSNLVNNSASATNTVLPRADVSVTKVATPDPVNAGQEVVYVVTALNNGPSRADNVSINDQLPVGMIFHSVVPSSGSCGTTPGVGVETTLALNTVACNLGSINNGAQATVTIRAVPTDALRGTSITNDVTISTTTTEPTPPGNTNNAASVTTGVANPSLDLVINKQDSVDPVSIGDVTTYTVRVTNTGPSDAEHVVITDHMPAVGLSFQSYTFAAGSCSTVPLVGDIGGQLICQLPRLAANSTVTMTVVMQGVVKGVYTNNATVSSDETALGFESAGNNSTDETTTVRTRADVRVTSKIATPGSIAVRRPFSWTIRVENLAGAGLAEADTVVVSDNLPAGMQLTGAPVVAIVSGTTTLNACTGVAGSTAFSCAFGTVSNPAVIDITIPVRALAVPAGGIATNSASIATFSQDLVPGNNSASGNVTILGSTLSGLVYRDFNNNGASDVGDTGMSGITMTLTGTAFDGFAVTTTATTDVNGVFNFSGLPQGNYTVTRGAVAETFLVVGQQTAGDRGGSAAVPPAITGIALGEADAGTGYRYAFVPQARLGLAKQVVGSPIVNANGSYNATLRLRVRNYSLEAVNAVSVTDALSGAAPRFGAFVAGGPAAVLTPGTYTINVAPAFNGACATGTITAGFDGTVQTEVAGVGSLPAGASCTVDLVLRYQPLVPLPGTGYTNSASATGTGTLSGQSLSDISQNGSNPDPDGDGDPRNNNTPTPLTPVLVADVTTTIALPGPVNAGQTVSGTVLFQNNGPYDAQNVAYTLTLGTNLAGLTFSNLPAGATATYNPVNGQVVLAGMPATLTSGEIASLNGLTGIGIQYTQPGTATSTVSSTIATSTSEGANVAPDAATATVVGILIADVTTSVTFPALIDAGQTVTGRVVFRNNGPSTASGMLYGITLTPGLSGVTFGNLPAGATATYNSATGIVAFTGMPATVASGAIASADGVLGVSVSYPQPGTATSTVNSTIGTTTNQGANVAPDAAAAAIGGQLVADVHTALTFPVVADAGTAVSGTVLFENTGPSTASGASYTLTLTTSMVGVTFGNLPAGATATYNPVTGIVTFTGMPVTLLSGEIASGNGTTGITIGYTQPGDGHSTVTSGIGTTTNQGANVALDAASASPGGGLIADVTTVLGFPATVDAGNAVHGTVLFSNNGPSIASGAAYALTLTPGLSGVTFGNLPAGATASYNSGTGVVTFAGMPLTIAINGIASGNGTTGITVDYTQPGSATSAVTSGIATTTNQGANIAPDAATTPITGALVADVTTAITFPATVDAATTANGTVTFRNAGPSTASGMTYTLVLTPNLQNVVIGNLPAGASAVYNPVTGGVTLSGMPPTLASAAIASGNGTSGITVSFRQPNDGLSSVSTTIGTTTGQGANSLPDAATVALVGPVADVTTAVTLLGPVDAGQPVNGVLLFRNNGPSTGTGITYTLALAPGLTGVAFTNLPTGAAATYNGASGQVVFTGMPSTLTSAQVASGDGVAGIGFTYIQPGSATSTVSSTIATATNQAANVAPDAATATVTGSTIADVTTTLTFPPSVDAGQTVTGRVVLRDNGPSNAAGMTYTLTLSPGLTGVVFGNLPAGAFATYNVVTGVVTFSGMPSTLASGAIASGDNINGIAVSYTQPGSGTSSVSSTIGTSTNQGANVAPDAATLTIQGGKVADLAVTKSNGSGSVNAGENTTYTLRVTNLGPSSVTGARVVDLPSGLAIQGASCSSAPVNRCSLPPDVLTLAGGVVLPTLAVGEFYELLVVARVTALTGSVSNTATVTAPSDVADPIPANNTTTDTDPVGGKAAIGVAKSASAVIDNGDGSFNVTFSLLVANLGGTPLTGVQLTDALTGFGTPAAGAVPSRGQYVVTAPPVVSNQTGGASVAAAPAGSYTGTGTGIGLLDPVNSLLATPGARAQVNFTIRFVPAVSGNCLNSATVSATSPAGTVTSNRSVNGVTPDTSLDIPTAVTCRVQSLGLAKSVSTPVQTGPERFRITYQLLVRNGDSLATATNVQVSDPLLPTFPTAERISIVGPVSVTACTGTVLNVAAPAFDGAGQPLLLAGNQKLLPHEQCLIAFTVDVDFGTHGIPSAPQLNSAVATTAGTPGGTPIGRDVSQNGINPDPDGDGNAGNNSEPTPVAFVDGAALVVTKTTPLTNVRVGQLVPYTITVQNRAAGSFTNLDVRDMLPAGFGYRKGTAAVDGAAREPSISGRTLTWSGLSFAAGSSHVIRLLLVVGSGVQSGEFSNFAGVYDPAIPVSANPVLAPLARADVRVVPDAVFDCTDIIGKVFDDRNGNGVQDRGEAGLAGVRLATVQGWLVTTDPAGRFHIACGAIPDADRGSTFELKLDPRTLPTGYTVTTENPRTIRVTAGKMADLTFGATLRRLVDISMTAEAFVPGTSELRSEWRDRIATRAIDSTDRRPTRVRLHYAAEGPGDPLARARLDQVAALLRQIWHDNHRRDGLQVEVEIVMTTTRGSGS